MSEEELEKAALEAISSAADRIGVDPFRLARFLAHGRIADFLQALGRADALQLDRRETLALSTSYLDFLEEEMRRGGDGRGDSANGNGG